MEKYLEQARKIEQLIDIVDPATVYFVCKLLDQFWKQHCEVDRKFLFFIHYTEHNHAAKGAWARLDYKLTQKLRQMKL